LKEEYLKDILEFDNDKEIEVGRANIADTISDKRLEFAEHSHEI